MPRQPDPDLEERILDAAHRLWKRGGEKSLTMRAVARAARTNTPAVYRRFKGRRDLIRGLLLRTAARIGKLFEAGKMVEDMLDIYVEYALTESHEYELFYTYGYELNPRKRSGPVLPIRESRPNFALVEQRLAQQLGGTPEEQTRLTLALWALAHGTSTLLLSKTIPEGHEEELRSVTRMAVKVLLDGAAKFQEGK
jgi:AcrR family transcriptional regulator